MTEKVNFDESLLSALEKAEEIIIKEFSAHYCANKYKKKFKISAGQKRFLRMVVIVRKTDELSLQYKLIFTDYYGKSVEIVSKSQEFDQKKFREDFFDQYFYAYDYQKLESRPF